MKVEKIIPPTKSPYIQSPKQFNHPLEGASNLVFMLGEDSEGYYLYGEGAIMAGAYEKFLKYVEFYQSQDKNLNRLMLHSPGGVVHEGLKIGHYIKSHKWITDSDKHMKCYSTCGFIFASGVHKRFQVGAEIGFHRPYMVGVPDTPEIKKQMYNDYLPYWNYIQGHKGLYDDFMQNYGRDEMFIISNQNVTKFMDVELY